MKNHLTASEKKLVKRVLKTVEGRMEGRTKAGLWTHEDESPEYFKETMAPSRNVMIDMSPAELRLLRRLLKTKDGAAAPLTPREEGIKNELKLFVLEMTGQFGASKWTERFSEIVNKMEGK